MEKIRNAISIVLIVVLLTSCSNQTNENTSENKVMYNKMVVQFQHKEVTITESQKMEKLQCYLDETNYSRNESLDDGKGWIYAITAYCKEEVKKVILIDERTVSYNGKVYNIEGITQKELDEVIGINRFAN